jgi:hypothetical protein
MGGSVDESGLPSELGAFDLLMHRGEANPRTRSGIMALEILDSTPDWEQWPDAVLEAVSGSVIASDIQASNVPIYPGDTYIAGAKVLRQCGIGPLPGVAMMVVLMSRGGFATITSRYGEGFDEVLALAGDPPPRVVPASFPDEHDERPRYKNGSVAYS